jgi:hypothetical protein
MQFGKPWMENGAVAMGPLTAALPALGGASILGTASSVLGVLGAGKALFGGGKESAPPPIAPPTPMPTADDSKVKAARSRSIADQMVRQGRESTILTQGTEEKLGG